MDELALNRWEAAVLSTSVLNADGMTYRAVLSSSENEARKNALACQTSNRPTSLGSGTWVNHFRALLQGSPGSGPFVKGALHAFEDDTMFGRTPTDQAVRGRLFYFSAHFDEKAAAKRAVEAEARARHPQASKGMSTPKDTGRDTKPGPPTVAQGNLLVACGGAARWGRLRTADGQVFAKLVSKRAYVPDSVEESPIAYSDMHDVGLRFVDAFDSPPSYVDRIGGQGRADSGWRRSPLAGVRLGRGAVDRGRPVRCGAAGGRRAGRERRLGGRPVRRDGRAPGRRRAL